MPWNLTNDRPIYHQLIEHIERSILSGKYVPGEKFPSVRELANESAVNPNTMQRALQELESKGLLVNNRTIGRTVTDNTKYLNDMKMNLAKNEFNSFYMNMDSLGFSAIEIKEFLKMNVNLL